MRLDFSGFPMWLATQCTCLWGCVWRHLGSFLSVLQNKCSQNPCLLNLTFNIIGSWMGCVCDLFEATAQLHNILWAHFIQCGFSFSKRLIKNLIKLLSILKVIVWLNYKSSLHGRLLGRGPFLPSQTRF